ncbi:MAG: hypothetical protein LQ346_003122 [Caloplaca aetnensis]|nr:MAG: hypothetical protein LQ346_003122 [Caloplaca aetnensis]
MSASSTIPTNPPTDPPPGTDRTLPPSAPIAPTSPSAKYTPPLRPLFISLLVATPILIALPPRKLDLYTFMLGCTFVVSAEELTYGSASRRFSTPRPPPQPQAFAAKPQDAKEKIPLGAHSDAARQYLASDSAPADAKAKVLKKEKEQTGVAGLARKLWYGSETEGWKERRIREEREALEEGRGYGDLIAETVREVFGGTVEREDVERFNEERRKEREREEKG